ncbi:hypothetical protein BDZ45DRAFT_678881, partial [Acephala macrosclerotiorum]
MRPPRRQTGYHQNCQPQITFATFLALLSTLICLASTQDFDPISGLIDCYNEEDDICNLRVTTYGSAEWTVYGGEWVNTQIDVFD